MALSVAVGSIAPGGEFGLRIKEAVVGFAIWRITLHLGPAYSQSHVSRCGSGIQPDRVCHYPDGLDSLKFTSAAMSLTRWEISQFFVSHTPRAEQFRRPSRTFTAAAASRRKAPSLGS